MDSAVVHATKDDDVGCRVGASFRAGLDVVQVEEVSVLAARDRAAVMVAEQHLPAERWRDGVGRSRRDGHSALA
jgi:hypothetical protein